MSLENEIKKTFHSEHNKAVTNLIYTYNHVLSRLQQIVNAHDLTVPQYNILKILRRGHPEKSTNSMIRERMLDKNSDVTRIVDRLIKEGTVRREHCPLDRRCVNIFITQKGLDLLEHLDGYSEQMDGILGNLTEKEAVRLNVLLDKIRK